MKLDKETYPDFYGNYPRILEEKTNIFISRRKWLREQWRRKQNEITKKVEVANR